MSDKKPLWQAPRPTLDQIKQAMDWWTSLGRPTPEDKLKEVRDALGVRPGQGMGADLIARYWVAHVAPKEQPDPEPENN